MEISALALVITTTIVVISSIGIIFAIRKTKQQSSELSFNNSIVNSWSKLRPLLSELFNDVFIVYQADKEGFDALLQFSVNYIYTKVQETDLLSQEEKGLLTKEVLRAVLKDRLLELYNQKYQI